MLAEAYEHDERVQARTSVAHAVTRLDLRRKPCTFSCVQYVVLDYSCNMLVSKFRKRNPAARNELSRMPHGKSSTSLKLNKPHASRAVLALAQIRDLRSHAEPEGASYSAGCDPANEGDFMPSVGAHCPRISSLEIVSGRGAHATESVI